MPDNYGPDAVDIIPLLDKLRRMTMRRGFPRVKCRALNRGRCVEIRFVDLAGFVAHNTFANYSRSASACRLQTRLVSRPSGSALSAVAASTPLSPSAAAPTCELRLILRAATHQVHGVSTCSTPYHHATSVAFHEPSRFLTAQVARCTGMRAHSSCAGGKRPGMGRAAVKP
jgi:hypothetical protein